MTEYKKCDYCLGDAYTIRIDSETAIEEILCRTCASLRNADAIDQKGIYISLKLLEFIKEEECSVILQGTDELLSKVTETKDGLEISLEKIN